MMNAQIVKYGMNVLMNTIKNKKYISTSEALLIANVTKMTIINWCKEYKIGKKIVGRWRIDPEKLEWLLEGKIDVKKNNRTNN